MLKDAFRFIDDQRQPMLQLWETLVNIDSGSEYKQGVDTVASIVADELKKTSACVRTVEFAKAGNMLVGVVGEDRQLSPVILMGHMDTAFPVGTAKERPFTIKDGLAYGPGVLDMKGGLTQIIFALRALQAAGYNKRPFKILFAGDEECGHVHSDAAHIMEEESRGGMACFNCETGWVDEGIVIGRKGVGCFDFEVHGVSVHPAYEWNKGRSAIREMAHKVIELEALTDWEGAGTTVNVGTIKGGTIPNQVSALCKASVDFRYNTIEQAEEMVAKIKKVASKTFIPGTKTELSGGPTFLPMETNEGVLQLFELVKRTAKEIGLREPHGKSVGGGSDAAYSVKAGVPSVCAMGPKGNFNHSPKEYAIVDTLFERTKLLVACILNLD